MSNDVNTELYELAAMHCDYWAGEGIGAVLESDLERDDLDALSQHLKASSKIMFDLEYSPDEAGDAY